MVSRNRYYFLVTLKKNEQQETVDLKKLKRRVLLLVWPLVFVHGLLLAVLASHYRWGLGDRIRPGRLWESDLGARLALTACTLGFSNLPDYLSIAVFLGLRRSLAKAVVPQANEVQVEDSNDNNNDGQVFPAGPGPGGDDGNQGPSPPPLPPAASTSGADSQVGF